MMSIINKSLSPWVIAALFVIYTVASAMSMPDVSTGDNTSTNINTGNIGAANKANSTDHTGNSNTTVPLNAANEYKGKHNVSGKHKRSAASKLADHKKAGKIWLMLVVMTAFIMFVFCLFLLITFIRLSRHYKKCLQIGIKHKPTEYIDAWSNYRLPDDYEDIGDTNTDKGRDNSDNGGGNHNHHSGNNDHNSNNDTSNGDRNSEI